MMNDSCEVEVVWGDESPQPSTWKRLQVIPKDHGDVSPILKKIRPRGKVRKISVDSGPSLTQYERSKKEVANLLSEWQRFTRQSNSDENSESFIPSDIGQESESEEENIPIPFLPENTTDNTITSNSLDELFQISGNSELDSSTATIPIEKETNISPKTRKPSIDEDWGDDDLFNNNSLLTNLENNCNSPSVSVSKATCSTPANPKARIKRKLSEKIKDSDMDMIKDCADIFINNPVKTSTSKEKCMNNNKKSKQYEAKCAKSKPINNNANKDNISEEILSQLIMDDSWSNCDIKAKSSTCLNKVATLNLSKYAINNENNSNKLPSTKTDMVFDDDDDDMLIEAAVLSESQQDSQNLKCGFGSQNKNMKSQQTSNPKKCSAKEIELKRLEAQRRKRCRQKVEA